MNPELGWAAIARTGRLTPVHAVKCTGANTERKELGCWRTDGLKCTVRVNVIYFNLFMITSPPGAHARLISKYPYIFYISCLWLYNRNDIPPDGRARASR